MSQSEYHQRRLDRLHRRYLSSIRTLAQVRKLLNPAVTQINVAEQQVNLAAEYPRGNSRDEHTTTTIPQLLSEIYEN